MLKNVYGNVVFSRSKMHARHKSIVFLRSLAICSCSLRLCKALVGFWWYWKSLGWFERFWKARQALRGFVRLLAVLKGLEMLCEVLEALDGFVMLWEALALEGFGKLLKSFGRLWDLASA